MVPQISLLEIRDAKFLSFFSDFSEKTYKLRTLRKLM